MQDVSEINRFIQKTLRERGLKKITLAEAARWLDEEGLLEENPSNPGAKIRHLIRNNLIEGQCQDEEFLWHITRKDHVSAKPC